VVESLYFFGEVTPYAIVHGGVILRSKGQGHRERKCKNLFSRTS